MPDNEVRLGFQIDEIRRVLGDIKYVHLNTDAPLCNLKFDEAMFYIQNTKLSDTNEDYDINATILELHCFGLSDIEITKMINKYSLKLFDYYAIQKRRQRSLKRIDNKWGDVIGVYTVLHEAFGEDAIFSYWYEENMGGF